MSNESNKIKVRTVDLPKWKPQTFTKDDYRYRKQEYNTFGHKFKYIGPGPIKLYGYYECSKCGCKIYNIDSPYGVCKKT